MDVRQPIHHCLEGLAGREAGRRLYGHQFPKPGRQWTAAALEREIGRSFGHGKSPRPTWSESGLVFSEMGMASKVRRKGVTTWASCRVRHPDPGPGLSSGRVGTGREVGLRGPNGG